MYNRQQSVASIRQGSYVIWTYHHVVRYLLVYGEICMTIDQLECSLSALGVLRMVAFSEHRQ